MPCKGYHQTKKHTENMSKALRGRHLSRSHCENLSKALKGNPKICRKNHYLYGKHRSKKTREKISKNHADVSGKNNPHWKKHLSRATKKKLSKALKGTYKSPLARKHISEGHIGIRFTKEHIENMSGKNSGTWQGGISFEPYGVEFNDALKREILERDNYRCQLCDKRANTVHHIDYNKRHNKPSNLCALCVRCNAKVNFNRKYWTRFFRKIIRKFSKARKIYTARNLLT